MESDGTANGHPTFKEKTEEELELERYLEMSEKAIMEEQPTKKAPSGIPFTFEVPDSINLIKFVAGKQELFKRFRDQERELNEEEANDLIVFFKYVIKLVVKKPKIGLENEPGSLPWDRISRKDKNWLMFESLDLLGLSDQSLKDIDFFRTD